MSGFWAAIREFVDGGFKLVADVARDALRLEFDTDTGRLNFRGMIIALIIVGLATASGAVENLIHAIRGDSGTEGGGTSALQLGGFFMLWTALCMGILFVERMIFGGSPGPEQQRSSAIPDPDAPE